MNEKLSLDTVMLRYTKKWGDDRLESRRKTFTNVMERTKKKKKKKKKKHLTPNSSKVVYQKYNIIVFILLFYLPWIRKHHKKQKQYLHD